MFKKKKKKEKKDQGQPDTKEKETGAECTGHFSRWLREGT